MINLLKKTIAFSILQIHLQQEVVTQIGSQLWVNSKTWASLKEILHFIGILYQFLIIGISSIILLCQANNTMFVSESTAACVCLGHSDSQADVYRIISFKQGNRGSLWLCPLLYLLQYTQISFISLPGGQMWSYHICAECSNPITLVHLGIYSQHIPRMWYHRKWHKRCQSVIWWTNHPLWAGFIIAICLSHGDLPSPITTTVYLIISLISSFASASLIMSMILKWRLMNVFFPWSIQNAIFCPWL